MRLLLFFKKEHTTDTYLMHATTAFLVLAEGGKCSLRDSGDGNIDGFAAMVTAKDWLQKEYERDNVYRYS
jgi:hypothetical protein